MSTSNRKPIFILGVGGFSKEVALLIQQSPDLLSQYDFRGYISHQVEDVGTALPYGCCVYTDEDVSKLDPDNTALALGVGIPNIRKRLYEKFKTAGFDFPNLIHPKACLGKVDFLGDGNYVGAGAVFTVDISVGAANVFNLNATVGHDSKIGSFNVINPSVNISGGSLIGDECLIGTGAQILENKRLLDRTILGAGSVLVRDIEKESGVYVGIPARRVKAND